MAPASLRSVALTSALVALPLSGCGLFPTSPDGGGPAELMDLDVGELGVQESDGGLAVRLPGGEGGAEYVAIVQSRSQSTGFTSLRLSVEGGEGASASLRPSGAPASAGRGPSTPGRIVDARRRLRAADLADRIRRNARRELQRRNVRPARPAYRRARVSRRSLLPTGTTPEAGDTLKVRIGVEQDLSITCSISEADTVTTVVQAVGDEVAVLADTAISDGAMNEMDWSGLAAEYDRSVLSVPEAYFGETTDIDGNERVLVVFTVEVNKLTERGSDVRIGGFFLSTDLADSGDSSKDGAPIDLNESQTCPAGNESELIYLLAPDPSGEFSDAVSVERARRDGLGSSPGEFQHLINAGSRVIRQGGTFSQLETSWLDEGLSHLAEEVVGLKRGDLSVRSNLDLEEAIRTEEQLDAFNTFHLLNFLRLRRFLINPDSTEAVATSDPRGVESLEMRGFAHLFLRWLGDQEGPDGSGIVPGSDEQRLFRFLAQGGDQLLSGIENVEAATRKDWASLIRDFATAVAADGTAATEPRLQVLTWNLPAVYRQLHRNFEEQGVSDNPFPEASYPLEISDLGSPADLTRDLVVQGSAARYFRLSPAGGDTLTVRVTDAGGSALSGGSPARVLVLRVE